MGVAFALQLGSVTSLEHGSGPHPTESGALTEWLTGKTVNAFASSVTTPSITATTGKRGFPTASSICSGTATAPGRAKIVRIAARTISALELDVRDGVRPPADGLIAALEGTTFKSPRGAVCLRCRTYNVVQDIYIRPVETTGAAASNVVVDTIPKVARSG